MSINMDALWRMVADQIQLPRYTVHGLDHWRRVERNGLLLAQRTGADAEVVRLFALFHDSQRLNDGHDPEHGMRGAEYAAMLRGTAFELSDERFELLRYACAWHTHEQNHEDPTIGTCWDADRLDLGRVGMIPDAYYMSTEFGKEIAQAGSVTLFL